MVGQGLKLVTRNSPLALAQVEEALAFLRTLDPAFDAEVIACTSPGDRDLVTSLTDASVPQDFFTRDLDQALLDGRADLAVHSAKDLPDPLPNGLVVAALLPAKDIRDALVLRKDFPVGQPVRVIGTSSAKRQTEIAARHPDAERRPLRGTIQARLDQLDRGDFDAILVAACALDRLGLHHRISDYLDYEPTPNQGRLAIVVRENRADLRAFLWQADVREQAGMVVLMGAPADADLLSGKARRYLELADVVFHDRLVPDRILLDIHAKAVAVGKAGGGASTSQVEIHRLMLHEAEQGRLVVRLHGGDPGIYGHLAEELEFLRAWQLRTEVVPGVTAAQIAAARAGAPLTDRGDGHRLTLFSGSPPADREPAPLPGPDIGNLAAYMSVRNLADQRRRLRDAGWPDDAPVVFAERLGYPDESLERSTVRDLDRHTPHAPAVLLIGPRAIPPRPAALFTGSDPDHFLKYGPLIHWPVIQLVLDPLETRRQAVRDSLAMDGILFPSRPAVRGYMEALMSLGDVRLLAGKTLLAVGPATADELKRHGLAADAAAPNLGGVEALLKELGPQHRGAYLYPCSDKAPAEARKARMQTAGLTLHPVRFYRNRTIPYSVLPSVAFDRVIFTSSSTVHAYFDLYPEERKADRSWIAAGPSTLMALQVMDLQGPCRLLR